MSLSDNSPEEAPEVSNELDLLHSHDHDFEDTPLEPSTLPRNLGIGFIALLLILVAAFFAARYWAHSAMRDSLPQLDGTLTLPGLSAPVTVRRDGHGVPYIHAASVDDLVVAQGFVTAQDRLWQMETLRRHGAGTLAEILGPSMVAHDRTQRTLQLGAAADRAVAVMPADQLHYLQLYARGVNASIAAQRPHLPLEFRLLHFQPAPWTPRDSMLVALVMYQDLTTTFPLKLSREILTTRLPPVLLADLYPVGSWRDHPPSAADQNSQPTPAPSQPIAASSGSAIDPAALLALEHTLNPQSQCRACVAGSNNWVVAGSRTASGKPLLSNDMHLTFGVPGIWYETSLEAPTPSGGFHVAGVALPGTPFIIVGHNDHLAWGFTNLGADIQDVYVERFRTNLQGTQYQAVDRTWQPVIHHQEIIRVRAGRDIKLDVLATKHGQLETPIISDLLDLSTGSSRAPMRRFTPDHRPLALAWTVYDPATLTDPFFSVNSATDWASLTAAFSTWGGPPQNMVYADDQGHIGYHTVGKIPLRGSVVLPSPLSPLPVAGIDPLRQWVGYIPYDQLPQVYDPPSGVLATANARITPDSYPFPISLDWENPYRNERIWKVLLAAKNLTPADMLKLQTDVYSDLDHVLAQRFAFAIDHAGPHTSADPKRLHQAADILRSWNGNVDIDSPAPAIVDAARDTLWPMLLAPKLGMPPAEADQLYLWGEKAYAEEQIVTYMPARWLPSRTAKWEDLLAAAVDNALTEADAPSDLSHWTYGKLHTVDIEHPIFNLSPLIHSVLGVPTGTGSHPQSGDNTTIKQVGRAFGPSERLTVDLSDLDRSTLNLVLGQSGNPLSPWFMDQFSAWYNGTTFTLPYTSTAVQSATTHTLTLTPQ